MTQPKLSKKASGHGGRGYAAIFEDGQPVVPSVTTILGAVAMPGISQWVANNTAAYCAVNAERLLSISEEQAYNYGRFYWKRVPDFDSPDFDPFNYHAGVLQDAADQGTFIHEWIEAYLNDWPEPDPQNRAHEEMIEAFILWTLDNDIAPLVTERTVYGNGYAGTFDGIGTINGVRTLWDVKSSRAVRESHVAQLAALGASHTLAQEVSEGTGGAVKVKLSAENQRYYSQEYGWFVAEPLPPFEQYALLQVRPDEGDKPAFCELHVVPQQLIDSGFELFRGALQIKQAQRAMALAGKEAGFEL